MSALRTCSLPMLLSYQVENDACVTYLHRAHAPAAHIVIELQTIETKVPLSAGQIEPAIATIGHASVNSIVVYGRPSDRQPFH